MFKRHVNLNTMKLRDLAGWVICVFSDKGVIEIALHRNWGAIDGILGFTNLSSAASRLPGRLPRAAVLREGWHISGEAVQQADAEREEAAQARRRCDAGGSRHHGHDVLDDDRDLREHRGAERYDVGHA